MLWNALATLVVVVHFAFILFVVLGGWLVAAFPRLAWFHLPAAIWGGSVVLFGWTCPLTPLENRLRHRADREGYETGFIEHYITCFVYPAGLTRGGQVGLGLGVVASNVLAYALAIRKRRARARRHPPDANRSPATESLDAPPPRDAVAPTPSAKSLPPEAAPRRFGANEPPRDPR